MKRSEAKVCSKKLAEMADEFDDSIPLQGALIGCMMKYLTVEQFITELHAAKKAIMPYFEEAPKVTLQ